jgi:cytochrome c553
MSKRFLLTGVLFVCGIAMGVGLDRGWRHDLIATVSAQQGAAQGQGRRGPPPLPTMESLPAEVAQLKLLVPSNSHIMMDVQFHWTNLWWAGRKRNWPLALYFFNESRGHIQWLIRKSPMIRNNAEGKDVDISGIFDGIDTSSLAAVKTAIEAKDSAQFASSYRTMLESCYACHKSVGRPYLKPMIPTVQVQSMLNFDPNAAWPE